jgi:hypothetical protein
MRAIDELKNFLLKQDHIGVETGAWRALEFKERKNDNDTDIIIDSVSIGFSFDEEGRFKGIFNYQE